MKDGDMMSFVHGQFAAIEDLCRGLCGGAKTNVVIDDLHAKAAGLGQPNLRSLKYGSGYDLILSLAGVVSAVTSRKR